MLQQDSRVAFLDVLRLVACFMVMVIHAAEPFYLGGEAPNVTSITTTCDAIWVAISEGLCRSCVPLFVMASSVLLFPVVQPTGAFLRRRWMRVLVPFLVWSVLYTFFWGGKWGKLCFNFPDAGGHLWFVPMLLGLYLLMPLLSPWAEKASAREVRGWIIVWLITTTFPYLRALWSWLYGEPSFGAVPYLYGECPWNAFGAFQYVSGFLGYVLLGFYFRTFVPEWSWSRTLAIAIPLWVVGVSIIGLGFYMQLPAIPFDEPYALAVDLEMSLQYCSLGVALTVIAAFMVLRKCNLKGWFYERLLRPLAQVSYGAYLLHMFVLVEVFHWLKPHVSTPLVIFGTAGVTFALSLVLSYCVNKIPKVGRWICG
jgi:surface polysaccharide O-acyltransferase-like enzyme